VIAWINRIGIDLPFFDLYLHFTQIMALARTTINEVKKLLTRLTTVSGTYPQKTLPQNLNPKPTTESHSRMLIPLSTKKEDMMGYIDAQNNVRIGRLLEDLDMVAGSHVGSRIGTTAVKSTQMDRRLYQ